MASRNSLIKYNDVSIIVMGATGSGKSTFINLASGSKLAVSNWLESCTQEVQEANKFVLDGRTVHLIDTPGFDNTIRSEVDILKIIAEYLERHYKAGTTLHGIIYIHCTSNTRTGGASTRSFRLFRKICGDDSLKNTTIVSNVGQTPIQLEDPRLDLRFFKPALDKQAQLFPHDGTLESAQNIIRAMLDNQPVPLSIQTELVNQGKHISDTQAGKEVESKLDRLIEKSQESVQKLKEELLEMESNTKEAAEAQGELKKSVTKLNKAREQLDRLKAGYPIQYVEPNNAERGGIKGREAGKNIGQKEASEQLTVVIARRPFWRRARLFCVG